MKDIIHKQCSQNKKALKRAKIFSGSYINTACDLRQIISPPQISVQKYVKGGIHICDF